MSNRDIIFTYNLINLLGDIYQYLSRQKQTKEVQELLMQIEKILNN